MGVVGRDVCVVTWLCVGSDVHACMQMGYGDDQSEFGVYGDFDTWCRSLFSTLLSLHPFDTDRYIIDDTPLLNSPADIEFLPPATVAASDDDDEPGAFEQHKKSLAATPASQLATRCSFYHRAPAFYPTQSGRPIIATLQRNLRVTAPDWVSE